jgi:hypothetical protein
MEAKTDTVNKYILFFLGLIAGSSIQVFDGLYLAHISIVLLFAVYVKFDKINLYLYLLFSIFCIGGTILNILLSGGLADYKLVNLFNTVFLYSAVLIRIKYDQFIALFKGFLTSFCFLLGVVIVHFKWSLIAGGFFAFFITQREWALPYPFLYSFYGNTFAIYTIIIMFIYYHLLNRNIYILTFVYLFNFLTTSRLSLFGIALIAGILYRRKVFSNAYVKVAVGCLVIFGIYFISKFDFGSIENFQVFSDRIEYSADRENLGIIAKNLFLQSPIVGNGPIYIEKYTHWEPHLHNIWFDIVVGYGIISLLLYVTIFMRIMLKYIKESKNYLFFVFILLTSVSQISLKAPFVGILLFSYINLYDDRHLLFSKRLNRQ